MIENLTTSRAGYFYAPKRRLSDEAVVRLFRMMRSQAEAPSRNLFQVVRQPLGDARYSAICFSFERSPAFLEREAGATERVFGFLMLVEFSNHVAVLKAGLDLPVRFKADYLDKIAGERVEQAIARGDAIFEQLRLKNMSTSRLTLRAKTFEADDLANVVPMGGANRFVPLGYRLRRPDGNYSATPSTGRISIRAERANHEEIVAWASGIISALEAGEQQSAAFIRNFARPMSLDEIPRGVRPTFVALDVPSLADILLEADAELRLVRGAPDAAEALGDEEVRALLEALGETFPVRATRNGLVIMPPAGRQAIGKLKIGKTRISLAKLELPLAENVFVEARENAPGADPERRPLMRYIDREDLFAVIFSDMSLAYVAGDLFRDEALAGGGENFLRHLRGEPALDGATSEKGTYAPAQTQFSQGSVFRAVADHVASDCDLLFCDDLGDEWADFIGLTTAAGRAAVSFYHAKHGPLSLGASPFHEAVGQALKNLGNMALPSERMAAKLDGWQGAYRNDGVQTSIARIMRGGLRADIDLALADLRLAPDLVKRVYIVTSSLSRAQVASVFENASAGHPPSAHFVQLYWLLTNYFSACQEVGATGFVVCRP